MTPAAKALLVMSGASVGAGGAERMQIVTTAEALVADTPPELGMATVMVTE